MRFPEEKMERCYPGIYTPEEQAAIDRYNRGQTGRMFGGKGPALPSTDHAALRPVLGPVESSVQ